MKTQWALRQGNTRRREDLPAASQLLGPNCGNKSNSQYNHGASFQIYTQRFIGQSGIHSPGKPEFLLQRPIRLQMWPKVCRVQCWAGLRGSNWWDPLWSVPYLAKILLSDPVIYTYLVSERLGLFTDHLFRFCTCNEIPVILCILLFLELRQKVLMFWSWRWFPVSVAGCLYVHVRKCTPQLKSILEGFWGSWSLTDLMHPKSVVVWMRYLRQHNLILAPFEYDMCREGSVKLFAAEIGKLGFANLIFHQHSDDNLRGTSVGWMTEWNITKI